MNGVICLHGVQEYQDGQLKNKYGDAFIRGNNDVRMGITDSLYIALLVFVTVLYISTQKPRA
eukprot:7222675-Pyramimonas_sp.AAC.1